MSLMSSEVFSQESFFKNLVSKYPQNEEVSIDKYANCTFNKTKKYSPHTPLYFTHIIFQQNISYFQVFYKTFPIQIPPPTKTVQGLTCK